MSQFPKCRVLNFGNKQLLKSLVCGGRALAVRGGERAALVSGDAEEGVEEEVSDALPQGGRLDEGGRPDAFGGA